MFLCESTGFSPKLLISTLVYYWTRLRVCSHPRLFQPIYLSRYYFEGLCLLFTFHFRPLSVSLPPFTPHLCSVSYHPLLSPCLPVSLSLFRLHLFSVALVFLRVPVPTSCHVFPAFGSSFLVLFPAWFSYFAISLLPLHFCILILYFGFDGDGITARTCKITQIKRNIKFA